ncbi:MAG: Response regulator [Verrucomicrobiota bacterium]|nr:Response regulator [Verrucomicrobiota bacterium]
MKILVVEDDPIASAVLEASLKALGQEVTMAAHGREAWQRFVESPHRLVISDWMMPELDGLELCRRVREQGGDYTYFILLSNSANRSENLDRAMEAGVDDFLAKPVTTAELRARLRVAERILNYATQVRQLQQIIPICGYCRKMRDDHNYWSQVEEYIGKQTGSEFSHGVCPDCYDRVLVPQMQKLGVEPPPYPQVTRVNK